MCYNEKALPIHLVVDIHHVLRRVIMSAWLCMCMCRRHYDLRKFAVVILPTKKKKTLFILYQLIVCVGRVCRQAFNPFVCLFMLSMNVYSCFVWPGECEHSTKRSLWITSLKFSEWLTVGYDEYMAWTELHNNEIVCFIQPVDRLGVIHIRRRYPFECVCVRAEPNRDKMPTNYWRLPKSSIIASHVWIYL